LKAIPVCYSLVQPFPPEYFRQEIAFYLRLPIAGKIPPPEIFVLVKSWMVKSPACAVVWTMIQMIYLIIMNQSIMLIIKIIVQTKCCKLRLAKLIFYYASWQLVYWKGGRGLRHDDISILRKQENTARRPELESYQ